MNLVVSGDLNRVCYRAILCSTVDRFAFIDQPHLIANMPDHEPLIPGSSFTPKPQAMATFHGGSVAAARRRHKAVAYGSGVSEAVAYGLGVNEAVASGFGVNKAVAH